MIALTETQRRQYALLAESLIGAPAKAICAASAKQRAWVEIHAYPDRSEAERFITAVLLITVCCLEEIDTDCAVLDFESLRKACGDRHLATIGALGAGFWQVYKNGETVWVDHPAGSTDRKARVTFTGLEWDGDEFVRA